MAVFVTVSLVSVAIAILTLLKPRKRPILTSPAGKKIFLAKRSRLIDSDFNSANAVLAFFHAIVFKFFKTWIIIACRACDSLFDYLSCSSRNWLRDSIGCRPAKRRLHSCDSVTSTGTSCLGPATAATAATAATVPNARWPS